MLLRLWPPSPPRKACSKLLGVFLAPGSKLVRQLNAPAQNLAGVLQAFKEKQEKQEAA